MLLGSKFDHEDSKMVVYLFTSLEARLFKLLIRGTGEQADMTNVVSGCYFLSGKNCLKSGRFTQSILEIFI